MGMCDWCAIEHETFPVALGDTRTGEIADADICADALAKMQDFITRDGRIGIYRYRVYGREIPFSISRTFHCDVIQA